MRDSMTKRQEEDLIYEDMRNRSASGAQHDDNGFYSILFYILKKFAGWMLLILLTKGNAEACKLIMILWVIADIAKMYLSKASRQA